MWGPVDVDTQLQRRSRARGAFESWTSTRGRPDIIAIHSFSALVSARLDNPRRGSRACDGARGSWSAAVGPTGRRRQDECCPGSCRRLLLPLQCSRVRLHCIALALGLVLAGRSPRYLSLPAAPIIAPLPRAPASPYPRLCTYTLLLHAVWCCSRQHADLNAMSVYTDPHGAAYAHGFCSVRHRD
jgi:hypothetical protein